jgi:toxin ParE1/3/4
MPRFRLTRKAVDDLRSIGRYTQQTWGTQQRTRYLTQLDQRFAALAETPEMGRSCGEVRPGYRKFPEGRHVIFYRTTADGIEIVRILHEAMDLRRHL